MEMRNSFIAVEALININDLFSLELESALSY